MTRGNNPHNGVMICYWISEEIYSKLIKIKRKTNRCLIDIAHLAIKHRFSYPDLYLKTPDDPRPLRRKFRVSKAAALELAELAWDAETSRSRYISDTLTIFLHFIPETRLCKILLSGKDVVERILE